MHRRKLSHVLTLALVAATAATQRPARAQEIPDRVYRLGEVVVSGRRDAGVESIGTVRTITAAEIQASGARSLDEAIALVPGLLVRIGGAGTPRIDFRGFRTRHVQLLLDGIPINDTYDAQFDPTTIPVEFIERIKVTTGGGSLLYGPSGNGGVINIITRRGAEELEGAVSMGTREGSAYQGDLTVSGAAGAWRLLGSAETYSRDSYPLSGDFRATAEENGGARANSDARRQSLFASARYAASERTVLDLTANLTGGENGVPPVTNYDRNDPFAQKAKYDRVDDLAGYGMQAAFSHAMDGETTLRGWTYLNQQDLDENRYDDGTYTTQSASGASHASSTTRVAGLHLQAARPVGSLGVATLGVMAETDRWESTGFGVGKSGAADFDLSRDLQVYSAALELEAYPRFGPGLVVGAAYHGQDHAGSGLTSDYSLLVGAYRDLVADTRLRASWARKVRFPSIRQLYDVTAGNLDLAAETTLHYEVGVERRLGARGAASVAAFQTDARDFIEKDGSGFYQNYEKYLFRGVEVAAEGRAVPALFLRGSYAYLHSEDQTGGGGREDLQYRPRHKLGGEASYRFAFGLMPYLSLVRVAGQYTYDNDDKEPLQKRKLGDYTLVDARLRQDLLGGQVQVNVGVDNLLDADYEQSYGLPQSGRTLYGGVRYPF